MPLLRKTPQKTYGTSSRPPSSAKPGYNNATPFSDNEDDGLVDDLIGESPSTAPPAQPLADRTSPSVSRRTRVESKDEEQEPQRKREQVEKEHEQEEGNASESSAESELIHESGDEEDSEQEEPIGEMQRTTMTPHDRKDKKKADLEPNEEAEQSSEVQEEERQSRRNGKRRRMDTSESPGLETPSKRAARTRAAKQATVEDESSDAAVESTPKKKNKIASPEEEDTPSRPRRTRVNYTTAAAALPVVTPTKAKPKAAKPRPAASANASPSQRAYTSKAAPAAAEAEASGSSSLLKPTSSDAYFASHANNKARRLRDATSSELISKKLPPLSAASLANLPLRPEQELLSFPPEHYAPLYGRWLGLSSTCPLMFHGLGDMRAVLERFVRTLCDAGEGCAAVIRGEGVVRMDEVVAACERALDMPSRGGSLEARTAAICKLQKARENEEGVLFVLIHDVGSPVFLAPRNQAILKRLGLVNPGINLIGSVSHIRAANLANTPNGTGPRWIWEALCTLVPRDDILSARAARLAGLPRALHLGLTQTRSAAPGVRNAAASGSGPGGAGSSEAHGLAGLDAAREDLTAQNAVHIFKSATVKARMLFLQFATAQLAQSTSGASERGMSFAQLAAIAARNFIARNEETLRIVLIEFTSHGLLRRVDPPAAASAPPAAGEAQSQSIGANAQSQGLGSFGAEGCVRLALSDTELVKAERLCQMAFAAQQ